MSGPGAAPFRTPHGEVDRTKIVRFSFDGRPYEGFLGDTLASALLAAGVRLFGRSFKYHRPRGLLSAGVEEPSALVGVGAEGRFEPNVRATDLYIYDGLVAVSQNRWPNLAMDAGQASQLIARFIPAGFYYKTFFGGPRAWARYERLIRRAAGLGAAPATADPDRYDRRAAFCDVLVVGSGPSGQAAAGAAARAGAKVILVEQDGRLGGSLLTDPARIGGETPAQMSAGLRRRIEAAGGRVLVRTTAAGIFDHGLVVLAERRVEAGAAPIADRAAQRLWRVRAREVILATGALERPLVFGGNDRPGVMLSRSVRTYVRRFGVLPGRRAVVATGNDDAYLTALALADAGVDVVALLDARPLAASAVVSEVAERLPVRFNAHVRKAVGGARGLRAVHAMVNGAEAVFEADLLAVSGGFSPVIHLHMHAGGSLDWDDRIGAFTPVPVPGRVAVGAAAGADGLEERIADGWRAGAAAAERLGLRHDPLPPPTSQVAVREGSRRGALLPPSAHGAPAKSFLDLQNDVTVADADLAWREGYRSVEHLKRYTTLGMGTDQGKTSNLLGLGVLAANAGRPPAAVGVTTFRPPYTPVTLGALAGPSTGGRAAPVRRLPLQGLHEAAGALWQPSGLWMRPRAFPRSGESLEDAALREAIAVRSAVGVTDVSSLAKFEVAGPDAGALLERVCATRVTHLKIGRGRYTFMLREDGLVFDDGTVWRIDAERFLLTSSTGGAERMGAHLAYVKEVLSGGLKAHILEVQEHWAGLAFAGPRAPKILEGLLHAAPPAHMGLARGRLADAAVMVLAASYSGERAFEIYAPSFQIAPVFERLRAAAEGAGGCVYGLEALELLRIEKGHVEVGAEIDGRRTAQDLGLAALLNGRGGYVGWAGALRPALERADRPRLVGLEADEPIPEGAMLVTRIDAAPEGHVSSSGRRILAPGFVGLGLLGGGPRPRGEVLHAVSPTRGLAVAVRVVSPHHYDPKGDRYLG